MSQKHFGVPAAVGKPRHGAPGQVIDPAVLRESWTLDVLAWAQYGVMAKKIDVHGSHAALPPVILPDDGKGRTVALDLLAALHALRRRPRAFSQMAGRYAPLVIGAQDRQRPLVLARSQTRRDARRGRGHAQGGLLRSASCCSNELPELRQP